MLTQRDEFQFGEDIIDFWRKEFNTKDMRTILIITRNVQRQGMPISSNNKT